MNPPAAEDFVRQVLADADLTVEYRRWLPGDDDPGKELVLYDQCPVCGQGSWSRCRDFGTCQLRGVGAGINAAILNWIEQLSMWPTPHFEFDVVDGWPVFKN